MSVIVLMYHHTPAEPAGFYDVALPTFRAQIGALRDAGFAFVKFSDCGRREIVDAGRRVAVTFDDGHASNAAAFSYLADAGIAPTAFVVRDWSLGDSSYLSPSALADFSAVCELGGHGATHRALTSLSSTELADELAASRDFVQGLRGGPVHTMALPGGHGGAREIQAAAQAGFTLVGNSRPLPHTRLGASVNRICINRTHDAFAPLRMAQASALHWTIRQSRYAATAAARRLLGRRLYGAVAAIAK